MNICGFEVVRKRTENYNPPGKGIWPKQPLRIGDVYYAGAIRMPWCDILFDFCDRKLPLEIRELYFANVNDLQGSGFALCRVLEVANELLEYSNRDRPKRELMAVYSPTLASMKGTIAFDDAALEHLGWEPFQIGGGSLFDGGIYAAPNQCSEWRDRLNSNGLLTSAEACVRYTSEYQRLAGVGLLEEIFPADLCPIEPIEVLSVRTAERDWQQPQH